ncbi:DUF4129 domain-containing protein [Kitasatospora viridis]|uniref:Uncharacterized protein DUF4129 n=1 Tax=Kitasatospora viridis TaxID=281105 RepID=A0A561UK31_9ACTN|nr:DUF4129 domain-containing protein [Kitasatospora viridis]TWF99723.1 uncharacterized protein DUF4129 [Kitasatospora viridis]
MHVWGDWGRAVITADGAPVTELRDPARNAAREELLKPAYHRHDPTLVQRISSWVWDQLGKLLDRLGSVVGGDGTTGLVLFLVLFALLAGGLWWRFGRPRRSAARAGALFAADGPLTAEQHRAAAAGHAAAGRWAEAVREQLRALIRSLEERTLLDHRPGRTADEAAREAGRQLPEHAAELIAAARLFDDIAFGERPADQAAHQRLAELDERLRRTRPAPLSPAGGAA